MHLVITSIEYFSERGQQKAIQQRGNDLSSEL